LTNLTAGAGGGRPPAAGTEDSVVEPGSLATVGRERYAGTVANPYNIQVWKKKKKKTNERVLQLTHKELEGVCRANSPSSISNVYCILEKGHD
jgi:hypothetical protein